MDSNHNRRFERSLLTVAVLFVWVIVVGFAVFEYRREREYRIELLNSSLQRVNQQFADDYGEGIDPDSLYRLLNGELPELRLTLIDTVGNVLYDSHTPPSMMSNHLGRWEVSQALQNGTGYTVRRLSESSSQDYFYSAMATGGVVVRSALPYSVSLLHSLSAGSSFLWFVAVVTVVMCLIGGVIFRREHRAREQLAKAQSKARFEKNEKIRIKRQLTHNINHELKTPVSAIHGCLETIIDNPDMKDEVRTDFLRKGFEQCRRLERLLVDLSVITRMDEAPQLVNKEWLSLREIIDETVGEATQMFVAADRVPMRINCEYFGSERFMMYGNSSLLRSLFANLIDNAAAYSGGRDIFIRFLYRQDDNGSVSYHFVFADNGIGVEPQHLPHLFERFYRVDKGRSRKLGGTGLGLSIVKNVVLLHGGQIEVRNSGQGGLEFCFSLAVS